MLALPNNDVDVSAKLSLAIQACFDAAIASLLIDFEVITRLGPALCQRSWHGWQNIEVQTDSFKLALRKLELHQGLRLQGHNRMCCSPICLAALKASSSGKLLAGYLQKLV